MGVNKRMLLLAGTETPIITHFGVTAAFKQNNTFLPLNIIIPALDYWITHKHTLHISFCGIRTSCFKRRSADFGAVKKLFKRANVRVRNAVPEMRTRN